MSIKQEHILYPDLLDNAMHLQQDDNLGGEGVVVRGLSIFDKAQELRIRNKITHEQYGELVVTVEEQIRPFTFNI